eukprot:1031673-Rhodomonas_salina.1
MNNSSTSSWAVLRRKSGTSKLLLTGLPGLTSTTVHRGALSEFLGEKLYKLTEIGLGIPSRMLGLANWCPGFPEPP